MKENKSKDVKHFYNSILEGNYKKPLINVVPPGIPVIEEIKDNDMVQTVNSIWNFPGKEGKRTRVIIYSNADEVELLVNGKSYGRKATGVATGYITSFDVIYQPGILEAINYHNKMEFSREVLQS